MVPLLWVPISDVSVANSVKLSGEETLSEKRSAKNAQFFCAGVEFQSANRAVAQEANGGM
jgi:hypothetical protein